MACQGTTIRKARTQSSIANELSELKAGIINPNYRKSYDNNEVEIALKMYYRGGIHDLKELNTYKHIIGVLTPVQKTKYKDIINIMATREAKDWGTRRVSGDLKNYY